MPWWTWIALGVFVAAVVATGIGAALVFVRLRPLARRGQTLAEALEDVGRRAEALESRLDHVSARAAEVEAHIERLNGSLERVSVLTWALGDVGRTVERLRGARPRK